MPAIKPVRRTAFYHCVGESVALTPPMGGTLNIYATKISQELLLANAKAMASSGLIDHGWTYMNIDDCWQAAGAGFACHPA